MNHPVSAVLPAAGSSIRMGRPKQLLPLGDKPVILHSIHAMLSSGLRDIVVVLKSGDEATANVVTQLPVKVTFNSVPESDMSESVRTGLRAVENTSTGILIHPADQPLVRSGTFRTLLLRHCMTPDRILIPRYKAKKGHPVLLPGETATGLFHGITLRDIIQMHNEKTTFINLTDEGILFDIDTPEDYSESIRRISE